MPHLQHVDASELLKQLPPNDHSWSTVITQRILTLCSKLEDLGAWTWNLWTIAAVSAVVLGSIRALFGQKYGVAWYAVVHAWISAGGAVAVMYLNIWESQRLTGIDEPLRSCLCHAPLTVLHRILPAFTMGYSLFDFLEGLTISIDFALHGFATAGVLAYYCYVDAPHFAEPLLILELSTVFFVMVHASFVSEVAAAINQALFVVTFFVSRCLVAPWWHGKVLHSLWSQSHFDPDPDHDREKKDDPWRDCYPAHFIYACTISGLLFHGLNYFWMYKIIRKMRRKMTGKEGIRANNNVYDPNSAKDPVDHMKTKTKRA